MHLSLVSGLLFGLAAAAAVASQPGPPEPQHESEVTIVKSMKSFVVKLDCLGCPLISHNPQSNLTYPDPSRENFLLLKAEVDSPSQRSVLLNGASVQPLNAIPPRITATQVPSNIEQDVLQSMLNDPTDSAWDSFMKLPLYYNHSVLPTQAYNALWLQLDVTGFDMEPKTENKPAFKVALDKEGQKLFQMLITRIPRSTELLIETVEVVDRKDRRMPWTMPCGKPAITTTSYDPNEWDQYGKLSSWDRMWNLIFSKTGGFILDSLRTFMLVAPFGILLAMSMVLYRRRYPKQRDRDFDTSDEETEFPLLDSYYDGAPPEYANVPVIKIEEYD